jgi:hypothetical protein
MHKLILITVALIPFVCTGYLSTAIALGHTPLGKHDVNDIDKHCADVNGTPFDSGGIYGCWGPGGDVTCSHQTGTCFGTCERCGQRMSEQDKVIRAILEQSQPSRARERTNPFGP